MPAVCKRGVSMNISTLPDRRWRPAVPRLPDMPGLAGVLAGLSGGLAMLAVAAMLAQALDLSIWFQPQVLASIALDTSPADGGASTALLGLLIHFASAAGLGVLFEAFMRRVSQLPTDLGVPELAGLTYGIMIWLTAYFVGPLLSEQLALLYGPAVIIQHLVFGAVTGLVYAMLKPRLYASIA